MTNEHTTSAGAGADTRAADPQLEKIAPPRRTKGRHMNALRTRPTLRKAVATVLFVFGVVSLVLPLLPGWIMIGAGLFLLSIDSPEFQESVHRYRSKYSHLDRVLRHSYDRLHSAYRKDDDL
jgi:hypothetical protein